MNIEKIVLKKKELEEELEESKEKIKHLETDLKFRNEEREKIREILQLPRRTFSFHRRRRL